MKNKKIVIPLFILGGIVILFLMACIIISIICANKGWSISSGRFYKTDSGEYMIIDDDNAMILSNQSADDELFKNLTTGDKILVVHDGVEESFPSRTGAYYCFHISDGDIEDISKTVISQFTVPNPTNGDDTSVDSNNDSSTKYSYFNVQYIRTPGGHDRTDYPISTIIRSYEELINYYEANKDNYYLERKNSSSSDSTIGFLDACDKYDDEYFKDHLLILVLLQENSGSIRHTVTGVSSYPSGTNRVIIKRNIPEAVTMDMAQWHIFVELDSDTLVDKVDIEFK